MSRDIKKLKASDNIAEDLDDEQLSEIGSKVLQGYEFDENSRKDWKDIIDKAMSIAKQTLETKDTPFPNSSNVKYPLITRAAIDFAARIYPELVQKRRVVNASVVGEDPDGSKFKRAQRVSKHMSYQLLKQCNDWETELDRLLHVLPILGTVFKKTYYDPIKKCPASELCTPEHIVVNYSIPNLEKARRITHILVVPKNEIVSKIRLGIYSDVEVDTLTDNAEDDDAYIQLLEQHCYLDLDEDGLQEPYIVVVHKDSGKILRIVNRFGKITKNAKDEVVHIEAIQYFTDFHFIRSPDGGFYSTGLGALLYPINAAINTLLNQLIDSGTLNNMQGGFIGRGLRLRQGDLRASLGEWKILDVAAGANLRENIMPYPTKEPSVVLFNLLNMLTEAGKDLIANNDLMSGKGQTQNVASSTVLAMLQQGMKIFSAISKRIYKSLTSEFEKIYYLNREHLTNSEYRKVLDDQEADVSVDYHYDDLDVCPIADPTMSSDAERIVKAEAIMKLPLVDPFQSTRFYLETLQFDANEIQKLLPENKAEPAPDPTAMKDGAQAQLFQAQAQAIIAGAQVNSESHLIEMEKLKIEQQKVEIMAQEAASRIQKSAADAESNANKQTLTAAKASKQLELEQFRSLSKVATDSAALQLKNKELDVKAQEVINKHDDASKEPRK